MIWFKRLKIVLIVAGAFGASSLFVKYLESEKVALPPFVNKALAYFEESPQLISQEVLSIDSKIDKPSLNLAPQVEIINEMSRPRRVCKDHSLGELKVKSQSNIYTWKDSQGVTHFSDKKPDNLSVEELELAGEQVFDYFSLNIVGADVPFEFKEKLSRAIHKMFVIYGQLIDKSNLKKVSINLRFIASKKGFERYRAKHAPNSRTTTGFYDNGTNEAVIFYGSFQSAFKTAIHESAHGINRGVIGNTNKWLNEGLAEYLEMITTNLSSAEIALNTDWFSNGKLRKRPIPLPQLFPSTRADWNSVNQSKYYATSWALIYFFMDNKSLRLKLAKLIALEQSNMCDQLTIKQVKTVLGMNTKTLQKRFNYWLDKADKFPHVI
ncbi:DUF4124 domain-containing protein [uncultured Paraglaciecola sp.]|uniref:DUF4124 domain-containing protein n=1 Tax=uncultured Paraglaciecola sp. TaxID=1765024 RepID=UPI002598C480|nr:DUF4124 domain-containing protein [uncultured Paraglaciecola sp.]